jgi:surface protein
MGERIINPIHNVFKQYRKVNLVNPYLSSKPFVSTWRTSSTSTGSSTSTQVKLPLIASGTYNFTVSWGDGSSSMINTWNQAQVTHTYSVAGDYTIKVTGVCIGWQFNNTGDRLKIRSIQTWGGLKLGTTQGNYFYGCANLNLTSVSDVLNLTGTTSLTGCFVGCTALTTINRISEWDTSLVTSLRITFFGCTNFNQSLNNWNTGNVTTIFGMFLQATSFNQPLNNWNTSSVTDMTSAFNGASIFNQPLNNWNTGNVTTMSNMFQGASSFNQNIGSWNVSNVANFTSMFYQTNFNNGGSNTINNWIIKTTGSVIMEGMFGLNPIFNQPLNNWNTSSVTDMSGMFVASGASAFNQNIGSWNVSAVTDFADFMLGKTATNFSTSNLDAIYNGWGTRPVVANRTITFGTAKYTAGASAGRAILTSSPNNWAIQDGGI